MTLFFPFTLQVGDKLRPTASRETMDGSHMKAQTVSLISVDWVTVLSADTLQAKYRAAHTADSVL